MPNRPESAPRTAFRFTARPVTIPVTVSRRQAQTRAVAEHGSYVGLRKLARSLSRPTEPNRA